MNTLYPPIEPYKHHHLKVDELHTLYIEECGHPDGIPVCFVHGGPGSGCEAYHRRFFDPSAYRIILFDQRGCGRSTPHAELKANTTQHLIEDMEQIRKMLGIEQWVLFGGSWGSTLSLLYAEAFPQRVLALIVRGIFLCGAGELLWFYQQGASRIFPDYWRSFIQPVPDDERDDLIHAYHRLLNCGDHHLEQQAAIAWSTWEGVTATMQPQTSVMDHFANPESALAIAKIENHYFVNNAFIDQGQILRDAHRLKDIQGTIVHGRYDMICPVENAWQLSQAWRGSELVIVEEAGHAAADVRMISALITATDNTKRMLL